VSQAPGERAQKNSIWANVSVSTAKYTPLRRIDRTPIGSASSVPTSPPTTTIASGLATTCSEKMAAP